MRYRGGHVIRGGDPAGRRRRSEGKRVPADRGLARPRIRQLDAAVGAMPRNGQFAPYLSAWGGLNPRPAAQRPPLCPLSYRRSTKGTAAYLTPKSAVTMVTPRPW